MEQVLICRKCGDDIRTLRDLMFHLTVLGHTAFGQVATDPDTKRVGFQTVDLNIVIGTEITSAPPGSANLTAPRRALGNCIDRYGREHTISEQTPINVLLDVIEFINAGGLVSRNGSDAATPAGGHKTIDDILAKVADIERLLNIRD